MAATSAPITTTIVSCRCTSSAATPAYFNVWRWVQERAEQDGTSSKMSPDVVLRYATAPITQLAVEWEKTAAEWDTQFKAGNRQFNVPPVFIIVCRDTSLAKEIHGWLANGELTYGMAPTPFRNAPGREVTVRVDSKVSTGQVNCRRPGFVTAISVSIGRDSKGSPRMASP